MAKKIEIHDTKLSRRVDDLVRQLRECYPDGKVAGLNARHKSLCNKIGEIWQIIGYETRDDFFEAYGFEFTRASNASGGRPVEVDGEELLAELEQRYDGIPKPRAYGILLNENPDLKARLKTLSNKSNEVFGKPFGQVLKERGILAGGNGAGDISDADIKDMLDDLASKYKDAPIKPSSIPELKADNPQYKDAITAFSARGKMIYGMTPRMKLIELGIYPVPKDATIDADASEVENAIDELGAILCDRSSDEKPKNIADLIEAYPNQGAYIKAGKKMGIVDKKALQLLGILSPTKAMLKKQGVRRVPSEELSFGFADVVNDTYVEPGDSGSAYLPPFVVGYDTDNKVELRTALIPVNGSPAKGMHIGDTFKAKIVMRAADWGEVFPTVRIFSNPPCEFRPVYVAYIFDNVVEDSASNLSKFVGAKVVAVLEHENEYAAQLEFTYLAELRSNTMIYVLRQMGIVKDTDISGGMGWRFRMRLAARGDLNLDVPAVRPLQPETLPAMEGESSKNEAKAEAQDTDEAKGEQTPEAKPAAEGKASKKKARTSEKPDPGPEGASKPEDVAEAVQEEPDMAFFPVPNFVLGLFAEDFFYFPEGVIGWNGVHHEFESVHLNAAKYGGLMPRVRSAWCPDMDDVNEVGAYINNFLMVLEADEGLRVPRSRIAVKFRGPVCDGARQGEGDLTGLTLANLAALGGAVRMMGDVQRDSYTVLCDNRLGKAIPQFYNLVARMFWDLRDCAKSLQGKPFDVTFILARNVDADQYFGTPSSSQRAVAGAQENPGTLHVTEQPVIDLTVEKKPAAKKTSAKAKADEAATEPAKRATAKKSAAKAKAGEESQAEAADAKQTEKKSPAKKRSAKAEADEKTAPKVQESAEKDEAPAKPKTVEQVMDEVHGLVESGIQAGAPAGPFDLTPYLTDWAITKACTDIEDIGCLVRESWILASWDKYGSLSEADYTIEKAERAFLESRNVRRPLGEGDFGPGTTLGKTVDFIRQNGGGVGKQSASSKLGVDAVKEALEDGAVIERGGKLYLWCHADESGTPICDYKQAILTLKDQLKSAEAAVLPFDAKKLEELKAKRDEAKRELDNAGFFAFFKKKELKERIANLEAEIPPLEKAQRTHQVVEDIKKKLESTEEAAKKDYKSRGLI
jgi:hypothetical protein